MLSWQVVIISIKKRQQSRNRYWCSAFGKFSFETIELDSNFSLSAGNRYHKPRPASTELNDRFCELHNVQMWYSLNMQMWYSVVQMWYSLNMHMCK